MHEIDAKSRELIEHPRREARPFINRNDVNKVMREMGMRYRKVRHVANSANSATSKVVRQHWALAFLKSYKDNRVYLNLDETWLGMSDFRRMKWQIPGSNNSVAAFQMAPRVSMFVALDTLGNVYLSLS